MFFLFFYGLVYTTCLYRKNKEEKKAQVALFLFVHDMAYSFTKKNKKKRQTVFREHIEVNDKEESENDQGENKNYYFLASSLTNIYSDTPAQFDPKLSSSVVEIPLAEVSTKKILDRLSDWIEELWLSDDDDDDDDDDDYFNNNGNYYYLYNLNNECVHNEKEEFLF